MSHQQQKEKPAAVVPRVAARGAVTVADLPEGAVAHLHCCQTSGLKLGTSCQVLMAELAELLHGSPQTSV
jgi:hypothetical protein